MITPKFGYLEQNAASRRWQRFQIWRQHILKPTNQPATQLQKQSRHTSSHLLEHAMAQAPQIIPEQQQQPMMNGSTSFWSNSADSIQYLTPLLQMVPSADSLLQLSSVDKIQKDTLPYINPNIASLYLRCAAKHLTFTLQKPQPGFDQSKTKQMISTIAEVSSFTIILRQRGLF